METEYEFNNIEDNSQVLNTHYFTDATESDICISSEAYVHICTTILAIAMNTASYT